MGGDFPISHLSSSRGLCWPREEDGVATQTLRNKGLEQLSGRIWI